MRLADYSIRMERIDREKNQRDHEEFLFTKSLLKSFDAYFFQHIQDLMDKIIYKIERKSGWKYVSGSFQNPYQFHVEDGEARFLLHRVSSPYFYKNGMKEEEILFLEEYTSLLKRLVKLEKKRDSYIQKVGERYSNVLPFSSISKVKQNREELSILGMVGQDADLFFSTYYPDGVSKLVSLLNVIADAKNVEDAYTKVQQMNIQYSYLKDLLRWASVFSKRGNIIYERVLDEHERIVEMESPSSSFMKDESDLILYYQNKKK